MRSDWNGPAPSSPIMSIYFSWLIFEAIKMGSKSKSKRLRYARKMRSERMRKYRHRHGVSWNHVIIDLTRVTCEGHSRDSRRIDVKFRLIPMNNCKKNVMVKLIRNVIIPQVYHTVQFWWIATCNLVCWPHCHTKRNPSSYCSIKALHSDELRLIFAYFGEQQTDDIEGVGSFLFNRFLIDC